MASDCGCLYFEPDHRLPRKYGLGAAALRYAALGFSVIPLARGGKRPHQLLGGSGGVHLASADPTQIAEWWSLDNLANIGVATGSVNRLCVVDLDVKGGKNGKQAFWQFLQANRLLLPDAPVAATPSGGAHLWFRTDGRVPERPGILSGVDVKGDGGLVVAAPSAALVSPAVRPGEPRMTAELPVPYGWVSSCPHAAPPVPGWFAGWLSSASPAPRAGHDRSGPAGAGSGELTDAYVKNGVPRSMRNREMYRAACGLYRRHGTHTAGASAVLEVLREIYANTDKTDFSWDEVLTCAESARRFIEAARGREESRNAEFLAWLEHRGRS